MYVNIDELILWWCAKIVPLAEYGINIRAVVCHFIIEHFAWESYLKIIWFSELSNRIGFTYISSVIEF